MSKRTAPTAYARVRLDITLKLEEPTNSFVLGPEDHGLLLEAIDLVLKARAAYAPAGGMPKVVERLGGARMTSGLDRRPRDAEGQLVAKAPRRRP